MLNNYCIVKDYIKNIIAYRYCHQNPQDCPLPGPDFRCRLLTLKDVFFVQQKLKVNQETFRMILYNYFTVKHYIQNEMTYDCRHQNTLD